MSYTGVPGFGEPQQPTGYIWPPPRQQRPWRKVIFVVLIVLIVIVAVVGIGGGGYWLLTRDDGKGGDDNVVDGPDSRLAGGEGGARIADEIFVTYPDAEHDGVNQQLDGVAVVGDTVVAVGRRDGGVRDSEMFLVSTDSGATWELADVQDQDGGDVPPGDHPVGVAGNDTGWVAFGAENRSVWTSSDAKTWTRIDEGVTEAFQEGDDPQAMAAAGDGFVIVGGTRANRPAGRRGPAVWLTDDGRGWERVGPAAFGVGNDVSLTLEHVAAHDDTIVAVGILRRPGQPGSFGIAYRSTNGGATWSQVELPGTSGWAGPSGLAASDDGFVAVGRSGEVGSKYGLVLTSTDGGTWQEAGRVDLGAGNDEASFQRLATSSSGLALLGVRDGTAIVYQSSDGQTWSAPQTVDSVEVEAMAAAGDGALLVGRSWDGDDDPAIVRAIGSGTPTAVDLTGVENLMPPSVVPRQIVAVDDQLVVAGHASGDAAVWSSGDGDSWTLAEPPEGLVGGSLQAFADVAHGERGWLAIGQTRFPQRPLLTTSGDGRSWSRVEHDVFGQDLPDSTRRVLRSVASGPGGYVVVGGDIPDEGPDTQSAAVWFSPDLEEWVRGRPAGPAKVGGDDLNGEPGHIRRMNEVVGREAGYLAVGWIEDTTQGSASDLPAVWTSEDGQVWALKTVPLPEDMVRARLFHVAVRDGVLAAVGVAWNDNGWHVYSATSTDQGATWEQGVVADRAYLDGLLATPNGFLAYGAEQVEGGRDVVLWLSEDGNTWEKRTPDGTGLSGPGDQRMQSITVVGDEILGVGYTADDQESFPTLWRAPLPS